jgi:predicted HicB family RNase H-like nuclease
MQAAKGPEMKRIVNGVTYNIDTSTRLAESRWERHDEPDKEYFGTLYETRGGAFFVDLEITRQRWNEAKHIQETEVINEFEPLSPDQAQKWLLEGDVEIFRNPFGDPPEAAAESEPGATIYIRLPASLKRSVDDAARAANLSANVWAMRCLERCLSSQTVPTAAASSKKRRRKAAP